ncbi:protein-tyrosine-phosphatase [Pseudonocardia sediminis]|uniref:Protein-tyrosine-phosphatase n=1 Tax=Pseudonocardia sediminis TaxID=1397368 RepID=A0A4Q7UX32_PSEST|nr:arsenate reductase ArsC [Pseudonocardia sediminis]RZT85644.1 protein-tyrosine-phosphatase [Pseudonocardia sediminis]
MGRDIEEFELLNTASQLRRAAVHAFDYYRGAIPIEDCQSIVEESYELLGQSAVITTHLVALADRWSIERLRRVGILDNRLGRTAPEVLFVDLDDSGPAAAAAALLAGYARGRVNTGSAGQKPAAGTDPALARVAAGAGLDLTEVFPKAVTREALQVADVVITLGRAGLDQEYPGPEPVTGAQVAGRHRRVLHWELPVLDGQSDDVVRAAIDDLDRRVLGLLVELLNPSDRG